MGCRWEETHDCQFCVLDCPERHTSINIEALEQMASVPTPRQRDEIDEWLEKECHIYAGACSSVENLKYSTAREVAEKLWKKEEPVIDDLSEYINELSKQFPEVSFAKLSRIAVRVAKWQKEQMIAKAVDGYVIKDIEEGNGDFLLSADYLPKSMGLKDQQKVKVIVIKED